MVYKLATITFLVREYDEAIAFFTDKLNFVLLEDTPLGNGKRWVIVAPDANRGAALLLAKASTDEQIASVGRQTGGRVFLFLQTDDFWQDYRRLKAQGIRFAEKPRHEPYGWVVVFQDLYGNKWDLVQETVSFSL